MIGLGSDKNITIAMQLSYFSINFTTPSPYTKTTGFPGGFLICISTWVEPSALCVTSTTFEAKSTVQYWTAGRGGTLKSSHVLASRWLHCTSPQDYVTFTLFEGLQTFPVNSSDAKLFNTWNKQSSWEFLRESFDILLKIIDEYNHNDRRLLE